MTVNLSAVQLNEGARLRPAQEMLSGRPAIDIGGIFVEVFITDSGTLRIHVDAETAPVDMAIRTHENGDPEMAVKFNDTIVFVR